MTEDFGNKRKINKTETTSKTATHMLEDATRAKQNNLQSKQCLSIAHKYTHAHTYLMYCISEKK